MWGPPYSHLTSTLLRPPYVHLTSTLRPPYIHLTSTLHPPYVHLTSNLTSTLQPPYVHLTSTLSHLTVTLQSPYTINISRPLPLSCITVKETIKQWNKATEHLHTYAIMHTCICQKIKKMASRSLTNLFLLATWVCYDVQMFEFPSPLCLSSLH